jgi:hypothetical protein
MLRAYFYAFYLMNSPEIWLAVILLIQQLAAWTIA